jgi:hypothetical protein
MGHKVSADIDDGWQACYTGPDGVGFHNASGYPNVDKELTMGHKVRKCRSQSKRDQICT